jgi:hypothetical protein
LPLILRMIQISGAKQKRSYFFCRSKAAVGRRFIAPRDSKQDEPSMLHRHTAPVCAENLDSNILMMKPTDQGMREDTPDALNRREMADLCLTRCVFPSS